MCGYLHTYTEREEISNGRRRRRRKNSKGPQIEVDQQEVDFGERGTTKSVKEREEEEEEEACANERH